MITNFNRTVQALASERDPAMVRKILAQPGMSALDRAINYFSPTWGARRALRRQVLAYATQYRGAGSTTLRPDWIGFGDHDNSTPGGHELGTLRSRSRDATRNDPVAAGAHDTLKNNIVGSGLKPQSRIPYKLFNISEERASMLELQAEAAFERFKPFAAADNRLTFDELQFLALGKIIEDGETIVIPTWASESWRPYGRCLEIHESGRLGQPSAVSSPNKNVKNGIRFGDRGQPLGYFIRQAGSPTEFKEIAARDKNGRPRILHIFPTKRPGQQRGIPFFAPVLTYFKDMSDYLEAELVAARVAACLAVFITKEDQFGPTGLESSTAGDTVHELAPGLISRLGMGESISVVDPKRPGDSFGDFITSLLRLIGTALGLPYELLVKDFSKTNYSSARASLLEGRRMFKNYRSWFAAKFCQPVWEMVIEEAYLRGEFDAPDFYEHQFEYTRATWIGGGWGWVDPVKEVEASRKAIDYGLSTLAQEVAAQGGDWEETLDQLAREQAAVNEREIDIYHAGKNTEDKTNAETEED